MMTRTYGLNSPAKVPFGRVFKNRLTATSWYAGLGNCEYLNTVTSDMEMCVRHTTLLNPPPENGTAISGTKMVPPTAVTLEDR